MSSSILLLTIIACEAAFWIAMLGGLTCRYILKWQRTSTYLLCAIPLIDLLLLGVTVIDLRSGSVATFAHGLAAAYLGFTVAFGRSTINWADRLFAQRYSGPAPAPASPSFGPALLMLELQWFGRCLLAAGITIFLSYLAIVLVNDPIKTEAFELWMKIPVISASLWFVFGPLWSLLFYWSPKPNAS